VEDMVTHFNIPRSFERLRKKLTKPLELDKTRKDLLQPHDYMDGAPMVEISKRSIS
jgi:hypothetical protein